MRKLIFTICLLAAVCFSRSVMATELKGIYTIDSSAAASATNFKNFASAIAFLTGNGNRSDGGVNNTAPFGVSGHVVFNVAAGTYSERVVITGHIPGASDTSTVSFDGGAGNAATRVIEYTASNSADANTLHVEGSRYVRFRNLSIRTLGQDWGWGVHLIGTGLRNIHIKHCIISLQGGALSMQSTAFTGIVISNSPGSITSVLKADSLEIDSNIIENGYYGVTHRGGNASASSVANMYRGNRIKAHAAGLIFRFMQNYKINNNTIQQLAVMEGTGISITSNNSSNTADNRPEICGNRITGNTLSGIVVSNSTNAGDKGLIANNTVNGFSLSGKGIDLINAGNWSIYNNTIRISGAGSQETHAGISVSAGSGNSIINNVVAKLVSGGKSTPVFISTLSAVDSMDYNQLYNKGTGAALLSVNGLRYSDKDLAGALGLNLSSIAYLPQFVNDSSMYLLSRCNRGLPLAGVSRDIDGLLRAANPSMGANEDTSTSALNDLAVVGIRAPANVLPAAGIYDLEVLIRNNGSGTINTAAISYKLNNNAVESKTLPQALAPCDTLSVIFSGSQSLTISNVTNTLIAYTALPNGNADNYTANDTIGTQFFIPLSGNYTIGSGPANDFSSFGSAVDAIKSAGISGPVVFEVDSGLYNERVNIDQPIQGASPLNTITFTGGAGNAATRVISYNSQSAADRNTVKIASSYVHFRHFTVKSTSTDYGYPFHITAPLGGSVSNVHIKNCVIDAGGTVNSQSAEVAGIVAGVDQLGYGPYEGIRVDSLEIDSNIVFAGAYGVAILGSGGNNSISNMVRRNTFKDTRYAGIFMQNQTGAMIENNTIKLATGADRGIELSYSNGDSLRPQSLSGNHITNASMGIYLRSTNTANGRGKFINNVVVANGFVVWLASGPTNWDMFHNTFVHPTGGTVIYNTSANGISFKNNILANMNATSGSSLLSFNAVTALTGFDNNIFYQANPDTAVVLFTVQGVSYKRSNFKGGAGFNLNSHAANPVFVNDTIDYRLSSGCFVAANTGVTVDINDSLRNNPADIGAYEFESLDYDIALEEITTAFPYPLATGTTNLTVRIRNTGNQPVYSADLSYQANQATVKTAQFNGLLYPCDTASVTFSGTEAMTIIPHLNRIKMYVTSLGGIPDQNKLNDTLSKLISTSLNGVYTVGGQNPDFITIGDVSAALRSGGITGPVTFNIRTGTYNDALVLDNITGSDSSITFQSEAMHIDSVLLTFAVPSATFENRVVKLNSRNVHFRYLGFEATGAALAGRVFELGNAANSSITHCRITGKQTLQHPGFNADAYTLLAGYGTDLSRLKIAHNEFILGSSAINLPVGAATKDVSISDNLFKDQFGAGAYLAYFTNLEFNRNRIQTNTSSRIYNGVAFIRCNLATHVRNNTIHIPNGGIGMIITSCGLAPQSSIPMVVSNNLISMHTDGTSEPYYWVTVPMTFSSGLVANYNENVHMLHNSIVLTGSSAYTTAGAILGDNDANVSFKNNLVANKANSNSVVLDNTRVVESDYNSLYSNSSTEFASVIAPGTIGAPGSVFPVSSISGLHQYVFTDSNSVSYRPGLLNDSLLTPDPADSASWSLNGRGIHIDTALVQYDLNNVARPYRKEQGLPDIGAYEFTPSSVPPQARPSGVYVQGEKVSFVSPYSPIDTIAMITWNSTDLPSAVSLRQYLGEKPPHIDTVSQFMYYYTSLKHDTIGQYSYKLELPYRKHWTGTIPHDSDMRLANRIEPLGWVNNYLGSSLVRQGALYDSTVTDSAFSYFTGTFVNNPFPLPVKLLTFTGRKAGEDVLLNWSAASELNNKGFEVQRSSDGRSFETIGFVKGNGSTSSLSRYAFTDVRAFAAQSTTAQLYYRLRQLNKNSKEALSGVITIGNTDQVKTSFEVYPNPFSSQLFIGLYAVEQTQAAISLYDITGRQLWNESRALAAGQNSLALEQAARLQPGVYFITVTMNGVKHSAKLIRE